MKNSSMYRGADMRGRHSRREILAVMGALPLVLFAGMSSAMADGDGSETAGDGSETAGIVMRNGWMLRPEDLARLGMS
ncbi:MAG: hypothetical protein J0H63_11815 [Rhizobiales bacterium]|nr:hypothetical protein [Hyphomicrobiales bacterium]MBN9010775.1 hypothetical protein [Hyphomicrobiales bacterium]